MIIELDTTLKRDNEQSTGFLSNYSYKVALVSEFIYRIKGENHIADCYRGIRLAAEQWWSGHIGLEDYTLSMALNDMCRQVNDKISEPPFKDGSGYKTIKSTDSSYVNRINSGILDMKALLNHAWTNMRKHREYGFKLLWHIGHAHYSVVLMSPDEYREYLEEFKDWTLVEYKCETTLNTLLDKEQ